MVSRSGPPDAAVILAEYPGFDQAFDGIVEVAVETLTSKRCQALAGNGSGSRGLDKGALAGIQARQWIELKIGRPLNLEANKPPAGSPNLYHKGEAQGAVADQFKLSHEVQQSVSQRVPAAWHGERIPCKGQGDVTINDARIPDQTRAGQPEGYRHNDPASRTGQRENLPGGRSYPRATPEPC